MRLCEAPTVVEGAMPCPREKGHSGEHYWWLAWEVGPGNWQAIVYSGEPQERRRRARGRFRCDPDPMDIRRLLLTLAPLKRREVRRRTPASEPPLGATAVNNPHLVDAHLLRPGEILQARAVLTGVTS